jgi:hypothetical protein
MGIQTAPLYVYPGMPNSDAHIDAKYHAGAIVVELSRPLPTVEVEGKYKIGSRLYIAAITTQTQSTRWTAAHPIPGRWPIYITVPDNQPRFPDRGTIALRTAVSNAELDASLGHIALNGHRDLPIGPCSFVAAIFADVLPAGFAVVSQELRSDEKYVVDWMSKDYVLQNPLGAVWLGKLNGFRHATHANLPRFGVGSAGSVSSTDFFQKTELVARAVIGDGTTTRLRIEIPDDLESRIERLLETATDPTEFEQAVQKDSPFIRQAKITALGAEQHDQAAAK